MICPCGFEARNPLELEQHLVSEPDVHEHQLVVAASQLQPGDEIIAGGLTVSGVQVLGAVTIVDFTDKTSTPPIDSNGAFHVRRV